MSDNRTVKTPMFRMSFPSLITPRKDELTGKESFEVTMLLPPGTDLKPFKTALINAMVEKFGPNEKTWPRIKRKPDAIIVDFDAANSAANKPLPGDWAGWTKISARCPGDKTLRIVGNVRDRSGDYAVITDNNEVYGGRWARAEVQAFYYSVNGGGLSFGLRGVQLGKHDTPFGGASVTKWDDDLPAGHGAETATADEAWQ